MVQKRFLKRKKRNETNDCLVARRDKARYPMIICWLDLCMSHVNILEQ